MSINVVSCDGGGLRGALTARILSRMEKASPGWLSRVDLFAGTSTGGILALALAAEMPPEACVKLYQEKGNSIFASRGILDKMSGADEYFRANYAAEGLRDALNSIFGTARLKDLQHDVLIPAFDMRSWRPKFFDREHDAEAFVVDVAMATGSAPTYFPAHGWTGPGGSCYADGGLFANNPADSALAFLSSKGADLATVRMISVGTGVSEIPAPSELEAGPAPLDWGYRQWIVLGPHYLLAALFDGSVLASHFRSREQLGDRYVRVQPKLTERIEMDDTLESARASRHGRRRRLDRRDQVACDRLSGNVVGPVS